MTDAILLDTCALLWVATGGGKLSRKAMKTIASARVAYVSPISAWEIAVKAAKGKIGLPCQAREWFERITEKYDLTVMRLSADDLLTAAELPWHHGDPADRFIIAQALKYDLPVATGDGNFAKYGVKTIC